MLKKKDRPFYWGSFVVMMTFMLWGCGQSLVLQSETAANMESSSSANNSPSSDPSPTPSSTSASCGSGDGSVENPIVICNATDLASIQDGLSLNYILGQNIDLDGVPFTPISGPFTGTINGNGYQISNLSLENSIDVNVGLFGQAAGATFTNMKLTDVNITGTGYTVATSRNIGALVGYINGGTISGAQISGGAILSDSSQAVVDIGGIAGYADSGTTITGSYSEISISDYSSEYNSGSSNRPSIGGIVGANVGTVTLSYSTADISSTMGSLSPGTILSRVQPITAGGIVGGNSGTIQRAFYAGSITCSDCGQAAVGGITGSSSGAGQLVEDTYFAGDMSLIGSNPNSGGIAGNAGSLTISRSLVIGLIPNATTTNQGGLRRSCGGTCGDGSYWATDLSSQGTASGSGGGGEKTKSEVQTPTSATGIYSDWNSDVWDFGTDSQYPALLGLSMSVATQRNFYQTH